MFVVFLAAVSGTALAKQATPPELKFVRISGTGFPKGNSCSPRYPKRAGNPVCGPNHSRFAFYRHYNTALGAKRPNALVDALFFFDRAWPASARLTCSITGSKGISLSVRFRATVERLYPNYINCSNARLAAALAHTVPFPYPLGSVIRFALLDGTATIADATVKTVRPRT